MVNNLQTLEQLHQLINNEVTTPQLNKVLNSIEDGYLKTGICYGSFSQIMYDELSKENNVFGVQSETEISFLLDCILNDDYEAFLIKGNKNGTTEKEWYEYTHKFLNVINSSN